MEPQAIMAYAIPRTSFSSKKCWSSLRLPLLFSTILYSPRQPVVCGRSSLESCVWPLHHNHWDHSLTDWLIDWLIYWLTDWLTDLLTEISLRGPGRQQAGRQAGGSASHYKVSQVTSGSSAGKPQRPENLHSTQFRLGNWSGSERVMKV